MNKLIFALTCFILSACSTLNQGIWFEDTDTLISQHRYQKALSQVKHSKPDDQATIKKIQRLASVHRRKQLKRVQTYFIKQEWEQAERLLLSLQENQPPNPQLKKAALQLDSLRNQERVEREASVALAQARLLVKQSQEQDFKRRNNQLSLYWWQTDMPLESEKKALANKLLSLSTEALNQDNYNLAHTTFTQALAFNHELKNAPIRIDIRQALKKRNTATAKQKQDRLIRRLTNAMNDENFEQILTLSSKLANPPFKGKAVASILQKAQAQLSANAQELEQQGDSIYRQGNIATAIELWQQAQALMPNLPGLKDKLTRAQKVKHKLDSLRQTQNQEP